MAMHCPARAPRGCPQPWQCPQDRGLQQCHSTRFLAAASAPTFITKTLPSCLAVSHHPDRGEREAWGSGRGRWARRRGCTASGGSGLGERLRKAPSTARLDAGLGKVSTHGCGHQILISGHVGAAVWGWNSTLCRCTGAKSHPAGADGQARAAEPAVLGASWPRGAAGGTRGAGGIALVASLDTPVTSAPALWSLWPGGLH